MSPVAIVLYVLTGVGLALLAVGVFFIPRVRSQKLPPVTRWPSVTILKPLAGLDDELLENLQSHLEIDYPGEFEILLGVRSEKDGAYALAKAFAEKHGPKVRLLLQQGEPGHNPKVNQLITLTREAKGEIICLTDSNVRVPKQYLREMASFLSQEKVGLASNMFTGVGEKKLGAILDNMTIGTFCAPNMAVAYGLGMDQIVGKSIGLPRKVLEEMGGWHEVKDVLAEDQRMGRALRRMGLRTKLLPSVVENVQINQRFKQFWGRHTRWAMIRFRVLFPLVYFEPVLNPVLLGTAALAFAPESTLAWLLTLGTWVVVMWLNQMAALFTRGHGFKPHHLLLIPVKDLIFFFTWVRGRTMRWVNWRGNELLVLRKTRLALPEALERARKLAQKKAQG